MLPGSYTRPINSIGLGPTLDVVASGVEIAVGDGTPNILVDKGAKLRIRGLSTVNGQQVQCGSPSAMPSELSLEGVNLRSAGASGAVRVERCTLRLERAEILNVPDISLHDSATLLADRVYVRALFPNSNGFVTFGSNIKANVQNSVFEQLVLNTFIGGATSPNVDLVFANTTFVDSGDQQYCSNARPANLTNFRVLFENSVLHALNPSIDVLRTPTNLCTFANTLLTKQAAPPPGSIVGDAKFVDAPQRDYHLQLGSAAIDVGMAGILTTDHDFDGTARPQGLKPDLGAFEFKP
jgi:hypothetical protein